LINYPSTRIINRKT